MHSAAWKNRVISSWKKNIKVGAMKTIGDRFAMVAGNKANVNFIVLLLVVCLVVGCTVSAVEPQPLTRVTVQLLWTHNSSFSGFYAAIQNGYYQQEGLEVNLQEGGATIDLVSPVLNGTAQFGLASADQLIQARAEGKPVKAIAVIDQHSPTVFVATKDSGITRPQDFIGKTIRSTPQIDILLKAMMSWLGIQEDQYHRINLPSDLNTFRTRQAQVWGVYLNNFAVEMEKNGQTLNIIYPDDYGVHFYGDTLFTTDDLIQNEPELVLRFLRATLKGYSYVNEHLQRAAEMTKSYNPRADIEMEKAKMEITTLLISTGEDHIGWMKAEVWAEMVEVIHRQGLIRQPLDVNQVQTMQFLDSIYPK